MNNKPNNTHNPRHHNEPGLKEPALNTLVILAILEAENQTIILADEVAAASKTQGRTLSKRGLLKCLTSLVKDGYIVCDDQETPNGYRMTEKGWSTSKTVVLAASQVMEAMSRSGWFVRIDVGEKVDYEITPKGQSAADEYRSLPKKRAFAYLMSALKEHR